MSESSSGSTTEKLGVKFMDLRMWPKGPWDEEPNQAAWQDEDTALFCFFAREDDGTLSGFVGVPMSHPLYGKQAQELGHLGVHGRVVLADENPRALGWRTDPHPLPSRTWWIGFKTSGYGDLIPEDLRRYPESEKELQDRLDDTYRDVEFVKEQCAHLAAQLRSPLETLAAAREGRSGADFDLGDLAYCPECGTREKGAAILVTRSPLGVEAKGEWTKYRCECRFEYWDDGNDIWLSDDELLEGVS